MLASGISRMHSASWGTGMATSRPSTVKQSRPEAALVEKIVNAVDARLMNECLIRGIDPASRAAPPSIRHAVSRFFENREPQGELGGTLQGWSQTKQLEQSQFITLAVTGAMPRSGDPCITIADCGEGQTPAMIPDTFLSIDRNNKLKILFVQGKFNMGGTGALRFCGQNSLQLIITKRNPSSRDETRGSQRKGVGASRSSGANARSLAPGM